MVRARLANSMAVIAISSLVEAGVNEAPLPDARLKPTVA